MSIYNNENTLNHYSGKVWLTKPIDFTNNKDKLQNINICIKTDDDFVAVDYLSLNYDGTYHSKSKSLGKIEDQSFRDYLIKTQGVAAIQDATDHLIDRDNPFESVCNAYKQTGSIGATSRLCRMAEKRVRRILITNGLYTSDTYKKVKKMQEAGKTIEEIQTELKLSREVVLSYMPYK